MYTTEKNENLTSDIAVGRCEEEKRTLKLRAGRSRAVQGEFSEANDSVLVQQGSRSAKVNFVGQDGKEQEGDWQGKAQG